MSPEPSRAELRLALPKGRMQEGVLSLMADAGIQVRVNERGYRPWLSWPDCDVKILKPQNIVEMVRAGSRDVGFAGADWVEELGYGDHPNLVELLDTRLDAVRVVVAAPVGLAEPHGLAAFVERRGRPLVVATEMPRLAQRWIDAQAVSAQVLRTYGATEVFPPDDADLIVDIAATGDTLKANKLEVIDTIVTSSTRLYASRKALEDRARKARIDELILLLESAIEARRRVMLDLNVAASDLERVLEVLPCLRHPTIAPLRGEEGYAVRAAVPKDDLHGLIPALKAAGATDLVVMTPTQLVR